MIKIQKKSSVLGDSNLGLVSVERENEREKKGEDDGWRRKDPRSPEDLGTIRMSFHCEQAL